MENQKKAVQNTDRTSVRGWVFFVFLSLVFLVFYSFIAFFLFPFVQQSVGNYALRKINENTFGLISYERVRIAGNELNFENVVMQDHCQDTIVRLNRLKMDIIVGPRSIIQKQFTFDNVLIEGGFYHQKVYLGDSLANIVQVFDKNKTYNYDKPKFNLLFKNILAKDFCFALEDQNQAQDLELCTSALNIERIKFRNKDNNLHFQHVFSNDFQASFRKYPLSPGALIYGEPDPDWKYLTLELSDVLFCNSKFNFDNYNVPSNVSEKPAIDYGHFELNSIDLSLSYFNKYLLDFQFDRVSMSAVEKSGFNIQDLSFSYLKMNDQQSRCNAFNFETSGSMINGDMTLKYEENGYYSWLNFPDEVNMNGLIKDSYFTFSDLYYLVPEISENRFIQQNENDLFKFNARLLGVLNKLRVRNMDMEFGNNSKLSGQMTLRDVTRPNDLFLSFRVSDMRSDITSIRALVPDLRIPASFDRLGSFRFSGSFDGSPSDFIAYGDTKTELGQAILDINIEDLNTNLPTNYSGQLSLVDFNMRDWLNNDKLDSLSLVAIVNKGKGLQLVEAEADLETNIEYIDFNGYRYKDIEFIGEFSKNVLNGTGRIEDENIKLFYDGAVERIDSNFTVNAQLGLEHLDLQALNFSKMKSQISLNADMQFRTNHLLDFIGTASLKELRFVKGNVVNEISNLEVFSLEYGDGQHLDILGDGLEASISGDFKLIDFYKPLFNSLHMQQPELFNLLGLPSYDREDNENRFKLSVDIDSLKGWPSLLVDDLERLDDFHLDLIYRSREDYIRLESYTPAIFLGKTNLYEPQLYYDIQKDAGRASFGIDSLAMGNNKYPPVELNFELEKDLLQFAVLSSSLSSLSDFSNFTGELRITDTSAIFNINSGLLGLFNEFWSMSKGNILEVNRESVLVKNFILSGKEDKQIIAESLSEKQLQIDLEKFDLDIVNPYIPIEAIGLSGHYNARVIIENIFDLYGFNVIAQSDDFCINGDSFGKAQLKARLDSLKSDIRGTFTIRDKDLSMLSKFNHYLHPANGVDKKFTQVWTELRNFPCQMLEYFAGESVTNTIGRFSSDFQIFGIPKSLHIDGMVSVDTFATTIDYLNSRINFANQQMSLKDSLMFVRDALIKDLEGNIAIVNGGIRHDYLSNLAYQVNIQSDYFKALNTTKGMNQYFYGDAYGSFDMNILGPLNNPNMVIDATSRIGTDLYFPLTAEQFSEERQFIVFGKQDSLIKIAADKRNSGVNMQLNLDVNENAHIAIIFDEQSGDQITGRGKGNLNITFDESGALKVYGNYDITEGKYLFTYLNFVNKPFILREGGNIQFTGDPYEAILNITADYEGLSTPVFPLIQEYLIQNPALESLSKSPTPVDLSMLLTGDLMSPDVDFKINFPELDRQLRNFADAKLATMENVQNELNRQVFGLLVVGTFLPGQQVQGQGTQLAIGLNTVSQMISNQLSNYLTGLVSDFIQSDNRFLSGFELDVNASFYDSRAQDVNQALSSSEIIVRPRFYLLEDRVTLDVAGNYNSSNLVGPENSLTGNFVLGIDITEDRRWKFRAYQRFEPDFSSETRSKTGIGLSYRRDFERFKDFVRILNREQEKNSGIQ
jgi:hypothetical protein